MSSQDRVRRIEGQVTDTEAWPTPEQLDAEVERQTRLLDGPDNAERREIQALMDSFAS